MLRIAIDTRMSQHSGIGTYVRGLLGALARLDPPMEVVPLGYEQGLTAPIYGLREQFAVPRAVARLAPRPSLLHVPHYNAPLLHRGPLVVTIHDLIHLKHARYARHPLAHAYARFMIPRVCRRARALICNSEATRRDLLEVVPDVESRVRVIAPGCDLAPPQPAAIAETLQRYSLSRGYVLYVGNLRPHKNIDLLMRVHGSLAAEIRPTLVLVGEDQMPSGWDGRGNRAARRLGYVPSGDLPALYAGCGALVFPSRVEGFGMPPLEAMACGAPVVCSTAGALPEVVGDAGILCDPADERAFHAALTGVLSDGTLRESLRGRGFARARAFTWDRTARETRAAYEAALGGAS